MTTLSIPNELANGDQEENLGDGDDVQENFEAIKTFYDNEVLNRDGSVSATGTIEVGAPTLGAHAATNEYFETALTGRLPTFIAVDERHRTLPGSHQAHVMEFTSIERNDGFTATDNAVTVGATGVYAIIVEGEFTPPSSHYNLVVSFNGSGGPQAVAYAGRDSLMAGGQGVVSEGVLTGGRIVYLASTTTVGLHVWAGIDGPQDVGDTKLILVRLKQI